MKWEISIAVVLFSFTLVAQVPESNLVLRLDYDSDFEITLGETATYEYQGGELTTDRFGIENSSCLFDEDHQKIVFEDFPCFEDEITISVWYKFESISFPNYPIVMLTNSDEFVLGETVHFGLTVANYDPKFGYYYINGGRSIGDFTGTTYDNEWHHLVGTASVTDGLEFYLDNVLVGVQDFNDQVLDNLNQILIGGGYADRFGDSSIDDIRVYNRVLESCEIESLFLEGANEVDCESIEETECATLSLVDDFSGERLRVYPNPSSEGSMSVEGYVDPKYKIINNFGQVLKVGVIDNSRIATDGLPSGIYVLVIDESATQLVLYR